MVALFVALGGVGYAAAKIDGSDLQNRTVKGKKLKRNTLGGKEVNEARLSGVDAAKLGGAAASEYAKRMWVVYSGATDSIARQSGGVVQVSGGGPGVRGFKFPANVAGCAWIASRGSADATGAVAGFISTELASAGEPDTLLVRTRNSADTVFDTAGFHLQVVC
jgi:hypothetical protein